MKNSLSFISEVLAQKPKKMTSVNDGLNALAEQIQKITLQLHESESKREELEIRVMSMNQDDSKQTNLEGDACDLPDTEPNITSGDQIQLESYKAIPEFSGKRHEYRSWRNQVSRRMRIIQGFQTHPKYEAALAIVRAKITGAAADILTNNKTPYNIICILKTLDEAYTDKRPLYAIEAQMESIKQNDKTLHEYHNAINFALNAIIFKVTRSYHDEKEQRSLIAEAQKKAIRTFIVGLRFRMMRHILYGQQPKTLSEAYAIAQTVFYDNEHLQLEQCPTVSRTQLTQQKKHCMSYNRPQNEWNQPRNNITSCNRPQNEWNQSRNNNTYDLPVPMEIDGSNRTKQSNWRQQEAPQKREYNSSRQRFEQPRKMHKINRLMETNQPIPEELISNASNDSTDTNVSSAFLEE